MIESLSARAGSCTAGSPAIRGRVTRSAASRSNRSSSAVVGTLRSLPRFLESIKSRPGPRLLGGYQHGPLQAEYEASDSAVLEVGETLTEYVPAGQGCVG